MANEIAVQIVTQVSPSGGPSAALNHTVQIDDAEVATVAAEPSIGTSWEALDFGNLAELAQLTVVNKDTTNFVQLAYANNDTLIFEKLLANRTYHGHPTSATIYAKADTAAVKIGFIAL